MILGAVELVANDRPLAQAIEEAVERLRSIGDATVALMFDLSWRPTMDVVEPIARALSGSNAIRTLTLVHPSAALNFIAAAVGTRVKSVSVMSRRSLYDEDEDEQTDATESNTFFRMDPHEPLDAFVRRSIREARARAVRRFALVFDSRSRPTLALADTLVEELLQSSVQEIGLVHPAFRLDAIAASVHLRLSHVRVACGSERRAQE
jgi:hypothetical protein